MTSQTATDFLLEPERYELRDDPMYRFGVDRREFFKTLGCGVVVLFLADMAMSQESGNAGRRGGRGGMPSDISSWLHIGEDGTITVFTGKAEVGQNIRTSLTQAVAEELRTPVSAIKMVMADTQLVPWDAGTFGSQSTPQMAPQLHRAAAAAREALLDLAADQLKTDRGALTIADGKVSKTGSTESLTFGQLTKGQKLVRTVDGQSPVTPAKDWKIAGTSVPKVDGRDFVTGKHKYASDIKRPGMLHGKLLRPANYDCSLTSVDTKAAEAMAGLTVVHDGSFIGVTAPDSETATHAIEAIHAEWAAPQPGPSSTDIYDYLKKNISTGGRGGRGGGGGGGGADPAALAEALAAADQKLQQTYTIAYIAHIPLEPRAAVAEWEGDKLTVWTGTQRPFGVRSDLAGALGISEDLVHVIVPDTGSGYGGKHTGMRFPVGASREAVKYTADPAIEAARLAKGAGKPVKVVWTRQEEFSWAYHRPCGVIDIRSGVTKDGMLTAWEFHNYNSGDSARQSPYDIPLKREQFHSTKYPLQQGSYRGLAGTANHFARETHMDELARMLKMDPLEFRLKNLKNERMRGVLEAVANTFGWGKTKASAGHGFGIAVGTEKGSYIATAAEVTTDATTGSVKVVRAVTAFECGAVVNPDHLKNQVEGALVMGLGGALFEALEFKDGMVTNPFLADYRVPRFIDTPKIEVVLVDRKNIPSAGAGETPIMAIAPAVGNAIFDASGIRLRSMPLVPDGLNMSQAKNG